MIKGPHPADLARLAISGGGVGRSLVYTRGMMPSTPSAWQVLLRTFTRDVVLRRRVCTLAAATTLRLRGLASSRRLAGPLSWEVDYFSYARDAGGGAPELLMALAEAVALRGGRTLFVTIPSEDLFTDEARRGGFSPSRRETLMESSTPRVLNQGHLGLEPVRAGDLMGLFRLYCASTPAEVRAHHGMTLELWQSSREPVSRGTEEWLLPGAGTVRGWVRVDRRGDNSGLDIMVRPEDEVELSGPLLDFGVSRLGGVRAVRLLVPEYKALLGRLAAQRDYRPLGEFTVLVRSLAARERAEEAVRMTAASR